MNLKKFKILFVCLTGLILSIPTTAVAGADSGIYLGLGAGESTVKSGDYSESDSAYKVLLGYNFGVIPLIDLAVEGSYVHFGNPSDNTTNVEVTGLNAFGLAGLSFGPFGILAPSNFF